MNNSYTSTQSHGATALESRYAFRVISRLSEGASQIEPNVGERLRFARDKALERARLVRAQVRAPAVAMAGNVNGGGSASVGGPATWWVKIASVLPLLALAAGLMLIQHWQTRAQISAAAEIDADLLADDLPPGAYGDPGFVEFLKTPRD